MNFFNFGLYLLLSLIFDFYFLLNLISIRKETEVVQLKEESAQLKEKSVQLEQQLAKLREELARKEELFLQTKDELTRDAAESYATGFEDAMA